MEKYVRLAEAYETVTGRKSPHNSTMLKWCHKPNRYGIRLQSWVLGGARLTTCQAMQDYIDAGTKAADLLRESTDQMESEIEA